MCLCLAIIEFLELERGKTKEIEKTVQEGSRITFSPFMTECQWLGNNDSKQRPEVWGEERLPVMFWQIITAQRGTQGLENKGRASEDSRMGGSSVNHFESQTYVCM